MLPTLAFLLSGALAADPDVAVLTELDAQVETLYQERRFEEAEEIANRALEIRRKTLGPRHADVAGSLGDLAYVALGLGEFSRGRELAEEALSVGREGLGERDPKLANLTELMASILKKQGEFTSAKALYEETLAIRREALGPRHVQVAKSLNALSGLLLVKGDFATALSMMEESLEIVREQLGPRHRHVLAATNNLAMVLSKLGKNDAARVRMEEGLAIRREVFGPRHAEVAAALGMLGTVMIAQGDYAEGQIALAESLDITREAFGPRHERVANALNNLGHVEKKRGDYAAARHHFEEAVKIVRESLPPGDPIASTTIGNLGALLKDQGDEEAARPLYEEILKVRREKLDPDHPALATAVNNLAGLVRAQGDLEGARVLFEESLAIWRAAGDDRGVALNLTNLANIEMTRGDLPAAITLAEEGLETYISALGDRHPEVAMGHSVLASVLTRQGEFSAAQSHYEAALDIRRESGGPNHIKLAGYYRSLATTQQKQGDIDGARRSSDAALTIMLGRLTLLDALSEREALQFLPKVRKVLDSWLAMYDRPDDAAASWVHVMAVKGVLAERARAAQALARIHGDLAETAGRLAEVRQRRARYVFAEGARKDLELRAEKLEALAKEQEALERQLMSGGAGQLRGSVATPGAICAALPNDSVIIDLLRYGSSKPQYLAFVMSSDDCAVRRIELGSASRLETAMRDWRAVLSQPNASPQRIEGRGEKVASLLLDPIEKVAGDRKNWLVVPDGAIVTIPLGALPADGGFLIEKRAIAYLDRSNEVLRAPAGSSASGALLVGGVDYDARPVEGKGDRTLLAPCNGGEFAALPGAALEAHDVADRFRRHRRREPVTTLAEGEASETRISEAMPGKSVVHIATHGFFATGECKSMVDDGFGYDPMLLSGIALAGANQPADPLAAEDGILTASEVAGIDLSGTQLVVLSACETGLGELASGQGVLGLRRAFSIAGARSLVMSLWSIGDDETVDLMDDFYRRLLRRKGSPPAEALRDAKLTILADQRAQGVEHPYAWAGFITSGI